MVELQDILLEVSLIILDGRGLGYQSAVEMDFKNTGMDTTADEIVSLADRKLYLDEAVLQIDRVDQLRLVDISVRFIEEHEGQGIQEGGFTCTVGPCDEGRGTLG